MIKGYAAIIDQTKVGLPISVFASVKLERQREEELDRFAQAVARWPEVVDCYLMTGQRDYLMRIVVQDLEAYERFLKEKLTRLDGVASIEIELRARPGQAIERAADRGGPVCRTDRALDVELHRSGPNARAAAIFFVVRRLRSRGRPWSRGIPRSRDAPFAAVARLLVAAERRVDVAGGAVDVDVAGAQLRGDRAGVLDDRRTAHSPTGRTACRWRCAIASSSSS